MNPTILNWAGTGLVMGIGATALIDLWAQLLRRSAGVAPTDWGMVGLYLARRIAALTVHGVAILSVSAGHQIELI